MHIHVCDWHAISKQTEKHYIINLRRIHCTITNQYKQQSHDDYVYSTEMQTSLGLAHEARLIYTPATYRCFTYKPSIAMQLD